MPLPHVKPASGHIFVVQRAKGPVWFATERLLAGEIEPGQHVRVDLADGALQFEVTGEAGQERESEPEAVTTA
jgi:hypothetical protein